MRFIHPSRFKSKQRCPDLHLPSCFFHSVHSGRLQSIPKPAKRYNLSSVSWIFPRYSYWWDMKHPI